MHLWLTSRTPSVSKEVGGRLGGKRKCGESRRNVMEKMRARLLAGVGGVVEEEVEELIGGEEGQGRGRGKK